MFSNFISQKFDKFNKIDINKYLNNKKQSPPMIPKKTEDGKPIAPQGLSPVPSVISQQPSHQHTHSKKNNEYDLRGFLIAGLQAGSAIPGKMDKPQSGIIIQISKKSLNILYYEGQTKNRIEIMADHLIKNPEHNEVQGSIILYCKRIAKFRLDGTKGSQWLLIQDAKDKQLTITVVFRQKQLITKGNAVKKGALDKLQEEEFIVKETPRPAPAINPPEEDDKQIEDDYDVVKFTQPTLDKLAETDKFRKSLKDMKEEDKLTILTDVFKVKKQYQDPMALDGRRRLRCPIHSCAKIYRQVAQLKQHMKKHPELAKNGIQLTEYGVFEYSQKALDLTLALGKMFPGEIKKIIRKMKTRPITDL